MAGDHRAHLVPEGKKREVPKDTGNVSFRKGDTCKYPGRILICILGLKDICNISSASYRYRTVKTIRIRLSYGGPEGGRSRSDTSRLYLSRFATQLGS